MVSIQEFKNLSAPAATEAEKLHAAGISIPAIIQIIMLVIRFISAFKNQGVSTQGLFGGGRLSEVLQFVRALQELLGEIDLSQVMDFVERIAELFGSIGDE